MDFVRIADFNSRLEAETTAHLLDAADIPYLLQSDEALFSLGGVSCQVFLSVPGELVEEARALIEPSTGIPESL